MSRRRALADHAAVAQNDHAVGDLEDLVEAVRNIDHADAALAQAMQHREQPRHLVGGQAGGGFVEHEKVGFRGQRSGDGDQRFFGAAQFLHAALRIDLRAQCIEGAGAEGARRGPIDQPEPARIAEREANVLGNGHPLDQAEILMQEGDRQPAQRVGDIASAPGHAAGIERMHAGEDLDQRGFAGPVFAQEGDDLAAADLEALPRRGRASPRTACKRASPPAAADRSVSLRSRIRRAARHAFFPPQHQALIGPVSTSNITSGGCASACPSAPRAGRSGCCAGQDRALEAAGDCAAQIRC